MDPLGANSPDFETRPEYNPSSTDLQRARAVRSAGATSANNVNANNNNALGGTPHSATGGSQATQGGSTRTGGNSGTPSPFLHASEDQAQRSESLHEQMRRRVSEADRPSSVQSDIFIDTAQRSEPPQRRTSEAGVIGGERLGGRRSQFQSRAQLEDLIRNRGRDRVYSTNQFAPQERERLRSERGKQTEPDNSEKHVFLPQITALCQELQAELNRATILANLRNMIFRLDCEPKKLEGQRMIPKFDRNFRPYRTQLKLNTMTSKQNEIVKKFFFDPAPLGTFPTFQSKGQFPDTSVNFNPVLKSYARILGPYDVCLDIEIPLPELKKSYLSILFPPTHIMRFHCCYLMKNSDGDPSRKLYVLPPGHYRRFTFSIPNVEKDFKTAFKTFTVDDTNEQWNAYETQNGFYFYRGKIFYLPEGLLITREPPKLIRGLVILSKHIIQGSLERIMNLQSYRIRQVQLHYQPLYAKYHEEQDVMAVATFHAERMNLSTAFFMRYSILNLKPMLDDRFPGFGDDAAGAIQQMEIAAYLLQLKHYRGYYGPAPPYSILKHEKQGPKNLNKRRVDIGEKKLRRESMPIGDDGLPILRPPFSRPQSKLTREEPPEEKDDSVDDMFHLEMS